MGWSRGVMEPYRRKRTETLRVMYGAHWNQDAVRKRQPMNMLELTFRIWIRNLIARNPSVVANAKRPELKPLSRTFSLVMSDVIREIELKNSLEECAGDAIMSSLGVMKVGITEKRLGEAAGFRHDAGYPFADAVDLDDLVLDMAANRWEAMDFVGNRYVLPFDEARESKLFAKSIKPNHRQMSPYDERGNEQAFDIPRVASGWDDDRDAFDKIRMWDVWVPREGVVFTYECGEDGLPVGDPVREVDWDGPEIGPYHCLTFGKGKGLMRLPPIASLRDLNDAINSTYRKLMQQANRQKTVTTVQAGAEKDAERVVNANDGETIRVDNPQGIKEMKFGGVEPATLNFGILLADKYSYMAGNLDSQGGLGQAGDTLGQEELLRASASQTIEDMQASMVGFTKTVTESLASWVFYDPSAVYRVMKPLGNSGIEIPVELRPKDRDESAWLELSFDIRPVSMQDQGNAQRLRGLVNAWEKIIVPGAAMIQQQGMMVDVKAMLDNVAQLSGTDEIGSLLRPMPQAPQQQQQDGMGGPQDPMQEGPAKPPVTTRNYVRKSVPTGGTRSARDNVLGQVLAGGSPTPQQAAMMAR